MGSSGELKLKVRYCIGTTWVSNGAVDVVIYRPGVGNVDSGSGTTDSGGYVAISFTSLEKDDEARVTITPQNQSPDSNHTYCWAEEGRSGYWALSIQSDSICSDSYYDQQNNIILALYN